MAIRQADLQTRIDYAVARKLLDTQSASGDAMVGLIRSAAKAQGEMVRAIEEMGNGRRGFAGVGEQLDTLA